MTKQASLDVLMTALHDACAKDLVLKDLKKDEIKRIAYIFLNNRFQDTRKYAQAEMSEALRDIVDRLFERKK